MTVILLVALYFIGAIMGAYLWDHLRTQNVRRVLERELEVARDTSDMWKSMYGYAMQQHARMALEEHRWSVKAEKHLRSVS